MTGLLFPQKTEAVAWIPPPHRTSYTAAASVPHVDGVRDRSWTTRLNSFWLSLPESLTQPYHLNQTHQPGDIFMYLDFRVVQFNSERFMRHGHSVSSVLGSGASEKGLWQAAADHHFSSQINMIWFGRKACMWKVQDRYKCSRGAVPEGFWVIMKCGGYYSWLWGQIACVQTPDNHLVVPWPGKDCCATPQPSPPQLRFLILRGISLIE